jgi:hypothetical protein
VVLRFGVALDPRCDTSFERISAEKYTEAGPAKIRPRCGDKKRKNLIMGQHVGEIWYAVELSLKVTSVGILMLTYDRSGRY